jgi:hypothetical protein
VPSAAGRRRIDDSLVLQAASRITERDRQLCRLLLEHQVLTTHQIQQMYFNSQRRTELRLGQLHQLRVLDRFRPLVARGSAPQHWVLDTLGAILLAAERGVEVSDLAWRRDKTFALANSAQLTHLVGTNDVFCSLLAAARHHPDRQLAIWWPARRCAARWGSFVRPDGYGVWTENCRRTPFLLEHDTGSEPTGRLADKVDRYARLFAATEEKVWVLFDFPGPGREGQARRALTRPGVPVATAVLTAGQTAADAVWLPVEVGDQARPDGRRFRLADLPTPSGGDLDGWANG